jgi:acetyltransferase-like isoleucine patch superfamily enzyme
MNGEYVLKKNVKMGEKAQVCSYCIIGVPAMGKKEGDIRTVIGDNARIRSHSVIYAGNRIGDNFQTGHGVLIRENNTIGNDVSIGSHTVIERDTVIGNGVRIHSSVFIPEYCRIEDSAWIGPNVVFTNALYPLSRDAKKNLRGPVIRKGAKIGANSTLLPGVVIGRSALVGAGSVVTKDVPDGAVVAGNPAKIINRIENISAYG